ncbi:MAG: hypothetical protein J6S58_00685, partial [Lentisphaeria bacterium]|nr:hypothetical protein [Lentisphaeria bacterium]
FHGTRNVWFREGDLWKYGESEKSFELLHYFYPRSLLEDIYRCPCPVAPQGWYTGTPYGVVDLFPSEGDFEGYNAVIFLGWHTFMEQDARKWLTYVKNGGKLLLTDKHLSVGTERNKPSQFISSGALDELLGQNWQNSTEGVIRRNVGKGSAVCFMKNTYPASLEKEYLAEMEKITACALEEQWEKGWIKGNEDVNFSVWDVPEEDGNNACAMRIIYLLNIRWWDRLPSTVTLCCGGHEYSVEVPYGEILTLTLSCGKAVLCNGLADVFEMGMEKLSLQSPDPGKALLFAGGEKKSLDFPAGISTHSL